jgi:UDP-N-acetylglucosamine--N-acetylmuramyl-(pentapeptide) pyrophosphoryl-undecaprenol N-acetylglucosamine transferase
LGLERRTILVSPGGSNAGCLLVEKVLQSFARVGSKLDLDLILARTRSKNIASTSNQHINEIGTVENLHEYIFASDIVISLAGKSTIDECLAYGTPGIFIPIRKHFEQEQNARIQGY